MKRGNFFYITVLLLVSLALSACFHRKGAESRPVSLTMYGLDKGEVLEPMITQYKSKRPLVSIKYKKFSDPREFENLLLNEMAAGEGPDIFYIHNTWLPRHLKKIVPLQSESLTPEKFSEVFLKVASDDFIQPDPIYGKRKIYALPLYVDTLALFYNKRDFEQKLPERGKPAPTWDILQQEAGRFREEAPDGKLLRGAVALGRSDNLRLAVDILYQLFLQAGVEFYDDSWRQVSVAGRPGQEAFELFLEFAQPQNKNFSWSTDLVSVSQELPEAEAFLSGRVSAIFGYSDLLPKLESLLKSVKSRSPSVIALQDIGVAPSPQMGTDDSQYRVFANYYGLAVSRNSKNTRAAWDFVQFLASKANAQLYHQKTKRPASRRDLIGEEMREPLIDVFVSQLGYARSYRIFSDQKFAEFLREAISRALSGQTPSAALSEAQSKMNELLKVEAPEGLYPKLKLKKKR